MSLELAPPRLRMFAGPNGSGKTTLVRNLARELSPAGVFSLHRFINADEILLELCGPSGVHFNKWSISPGWEDVKRFVAGDTRVSQDNPFWESAKLEGNRLMAVAADSYVAAAIAEFVRHELLSRRLSFSYETVMSHVSKVEFFKAARDEGYRTYLYFICTNLPALNVRRIKQRTGLGGHDVPSRKVRERYVRSLRLVPSAIDSAVRAFVFDNTGAAPVWLAEKTPDGLLHLRLPPNDCPAWFKDAVLPFARLAV